MDSIYTAAFLSFVVGALGYFIARFWIVPIGRYRICKRRLLRSLLSFQQQLTKQENNKNSIASSKALFTAIRKDSMAIADLYNGDLPYWYRLVLLSRQEDPLKANESALKLENCRDIHHARRHLTQLGTLLRLKHFGQ